jgi:hypothetical protein
MLSINPTARIVNSQAFRLGTLDAQLSELCVPEMYYRHPVDLRDYCAGYAATAGHNITTRYFLPDAEAQALAEDYEEDMLDREYHARGSW